MAYRQNVSSCYPLRSMDNTKQNTIAADTVWQASVCIFMNVLTGITYLLYIDHLQNGGPLYIVKWYRRASSKLYAGAVHVASVTRAYASKRGRLVGLPLRADKEKPHSFRLFGADQCIIGTDRCC